MTDDRDLNVENRVATLEADLAAIKGGIIDIKRYLYKGSDQHLELMQVLAVLKSRQEDTLTYQKKCDADRADLASRVTVVEGSQTNQKKLAGFIGASAALAITTAVEWFKK